jgi:hypothetical protein
MGTELPWVEAEMSMLAWLEARLWASEQPKAALLTRQVGLAASA